MVLCICKKGTSQTRDACSECQDACGTNNYDHCIDDQTLGMATDIVITLLVLTYVFFILLLYFVIKTLQRCKGKPKWLSPLLITLLVLILVLGWVPILNIILIVVLIVVIIHYYTVCNIRKN